MGASNRATDAEIRLFSKETTNSKIQLSLDMMNQLQ